MHGDVYTGRESRQRGRNASSSQASPYQPTAGTWLHYGTYRSLSTTQPSGSMGVAIWQEARLPRLPRLNCHADATTAAYMEKFPMCFDPDALDGFPPSSAGLQTRAPTKCSRLAAQVGLGQEDPGYTAQERCEQADPRGTCVTELHMDVSCVRTASMLTSLALGRAKKRPFNERRSLEPSPW